MAKLAKRIQKIREGIDPGPAETRNVVEVMKTGEHVDLIPMNLKEALDALAADPIVLEAMPGRLYELYDLMKRDDWQRFLKEVTNWDIGRYMNCLP